MCSVETILPILIFPRLAIYNMILILSCNAGQWLWANHKGKQPIHLESFCFSLSVQYSTPCMRYSVLYYKIGFLF